MKKDLC